MEIHLFTLLLHFAFNGISGTNGDKVYSEELSAEYYQMSLMKSYGEYSTFTIFSTKGNYSLSGSNYTTNCALRPVITVSADSVSDTSEGASANIDKFYKNKIGADAKGYIKADSIAELLGRDIKSINKISSGLPIMESDMTWSRLTDGGYDLKSSQFDTSKYDYYIADRTTTLQVRLTGAPAYNNGVLALDTICNNLYGNLTEIKLKNGQTKHYAN